MREPSIYIFSIIGIISQINDKDVKLVLLLKLVEEIIIYPAGV